jgi:hypothetical protein
MTPHANLFERDWDFEFGGVGMTAVARRAGAELLGATVYELEPGSFENRSDKTARVLLVSTMNMPDDVEYLERDDVFVLTEAPYTDRAEPEQGRLLRVFHRADGKPVPPDE